MLEILFNAHTVKTGINLATPILLGALGGVICYKSGIFNIALEGNMLIGSFAAIVGSYFFGNAWAGVLLAIGVTVIASLIYGLFCITFRANEIIVGFGFNMFALGITGWLLLPVFGGKGSFFDPSTPTVGNLKFSFLENIPVINTLLNGHNIIVYISWLLVILLYILLYRTAIGYRMRALGENPDSLRVSGLRRDFYAYLAIIISGACCGLGGAYLSIAYLAMFTENITAGIGFISVTAVIFSKGYILITALAAYLFGMAHSIGIQLQGVGLPTQFVEMIPYVLTVIMLIPTAFRIKRIYFKKADVQVK